MIAPTRSRFTAWRLLVWGGALAFLAFPLVGMQFSDEIHWTGGDFAAMGVLLGIVCLAFEVAARLATSQAFLVASSMAIGASFLLVWINLAVGIIGSEDNRENLLFAGVLVVAITGSLLARLQPRRMAWAMWATGAVQAAVGVYALVGGHLEAVFLCVLFTGVWTTSGLIYRDVARRTA